MSYGMPSPQLFNGPTGRLAYVDVDPGGAATPVIMLHGGGVDRRMWRHQFGAFGDRRTVAPDASGHGRSATPHGPRRLCDEVVALLDVLEIDRAVLAGVSMGGATAVDAALEHPDRVAGLVVSGAGTSEPDFRDPWVLGIFAEWQRTQDARDLEGWIKACLTFVPGPHRTAGDVEASVWRDVETMVRETLATHLRLDENGAPIVPPPPIPVLETWSRLFGITVPVLAVSGALDGDDHLRMARDLADAVLHGSEITIDGSAHYPNMERPAEFNAAVNAFLDRHGL